MTTGVQPFVQRPERSMQMVRLDRVNTYPLVDLAKWAISSGPA